ncbi:MAG TPA: CinA family protein [Pseudomonas xinjiangensis]|uniref:CinA family protein n=2 Tax=root TaxID=1 RepID=A0A7V1FRX7_9GAMM|nr:CinA family protein [Halopseudomonas xinjiangensis]HEC46903.1 CinA family protein [Halopseudomonas xinjiangensis]
MRSVEHVVDFLKSHQLSVATAESCTSGLIAAKIGDIPGCGAVFERGYVVYSPEAKNDCLGVSFDTIEEYGLTSEPVAREMALGALRHSGSNMAIANTGVAQADSELDGVVCFACALLIDGCEKVTSETVKFDGSRNEVREAAAMYALLQIPQYFDSLVRS